MNNLAIPTNEKAHTDSGMDFVKFIADFKTANQTDLTTQTLSNLSCLLDDDKLKIVDCDITIDENEIGRAHV